MLNSSFCPVGGGERGGSTVRRSTWPSCRPTCTTSQMPRHWTGPKMELISRGASQAAGRPGCGAST